MLDLPRYLLGAAELVWLVGFAWLGATVLRTRLVPGLSGAPARLATAVPAFALLLWPAELLGTLSLFEPVPYLLLVAAIGVALCVVVGRRGCPAGAAGSPASPRPLRRPAAASTGEEPSKPERHPRRPSAAAAISVAIAVVAILKFGIDLKPKLTTGMTGFDSTWYHGPFAAGFAGAGDTWSLHFIAPQFLAWFYPANAEVAHAAGMLAFGRDLLSPLLNLAWLGGCLAACWCLGRPYRVAPWSLALGAIALSVPALADQAGEARNDLVGIFFLLAAVAIVLGSRPTQGEGGSRAHDRDPPSGALLLAGLAAGLAAGTKLNFLPPATVLVLGAALLLPRGRRLGALGIGVLAALAGGGYWYLRNLVHSGNPLPWFTDLGPLRLPGPAQELGGREGHSVLGYLTDGAVWSEWLLPGLRDGLTVIWPGLLAVAAAGIASCVIGGGRREGRDGALALAALAGLAAALAWLVAPTSASGPEGVPRGFVSGLRYLAPALVLGLALLPAAPRWRSSFVSLGETNDERDGGPSTGRSRSPLVTAWVTSADLVPRRARAALAAAALLAALAVGYPVGRHYLESRYADPTFSAPGLDAAFAWARDVHGSRIATTGTRQYPLFGTDLSNEVEFVGERRPHGGFVAPADCRTWRRLIDAGDYDYVVATRDREEAGKPSYPPAATWTESPRATVILRKPPTVVFELEGELDPSACGR